MTTETETATRTTPRGKLHGVAPYVRHMWHVLYRATRRHSVRIDELLVRVDRLETLVAELRGARGEQLRHEVRLTSRLVEVEQVSADLDRRLRSLDRYVDTGELP